MSNQTEIEQRLAIVEATLTQLQQQISPPSLSERKQHYDITKTKTWSTIGKYQIPNPDPQYIVSDRGSQELITNYAESVDDILNPPADSI